MKKIIVSLALCIGLTIAPTKRSHAIIWEVVQQALIAAIKAADLAVQRLQNKTIWLQNAQKTLENTLTKLKLDEISDWLEKNKDQYAKYYAELKQVKELISGYQQVREIMTKQLRIVNEYKRALSLFRQDKHFTTSEINYMFQVYTGIVNESVKNLDQLFLVINAFQTEMTDGKRLGIIAEVAGHLDENLNDLREFNSQNVRLSLQRSKDQREIEQVKAMYGIE